VYIFYDSNGAIKSIAVANKAIENYSSPFEGLTELFLDDTQYADVQKEPNMYKVVNNVPVKQSAPVTTPVSPTPSTEQRLAAVEAAIASLMGVGK
jgi:hypothetical protein